jgi:hypothetical protein
MNPSLIREMAMRSMRLEYRDALWGDVDVELHFDPSMRAIRSLMERSRQGMVRGVHHEGTTVVFDAWKATHALVRAALGHPLSHFDREGCDFWVVMDGEEPFSQDWETSEDNAVRDGLRLITGRNVEALADCRLFDWFSARAQAAPKP